MNNDQKNRMKEIQKRKKKREEHRKKVMRCVFGVAAILLAVIIVVAAKSCSSTDNNEVEVTVSPSPTASTNRQIDAEFYEDTCFIGNTFVKDIEYYDFIEGADYICDDNLDVSDALTEEPDNESVVYIDKLNNNKTYKKIFMMFGENELSWSDNDEFISEYKKLINKAKRYQPDAQIYLISVTPVTEDVDDAAEDGITITNIEKMNKRIKQLAKDTDVIYCDIFDTIANSRGYLSSSASEDGIHFSESYYEKTLVYIQKNYTEEALKKAENSSKDDDTSSSSKSSSNNSSGTTSSNSSSSDNSSSNSSSGSNKSNSSSSSSNSSNSSSSNSSKGSNSSSTSSSSNNNSSSSSNSSGSSNKSNSSSSSSSGSNNTSSSSNSSTGSNNTSSSSSSSNNSSSGNTSSGTGSSSTNNSSSTSSEQSSGSVSSGALSMDLDE